jgi:wobble nucleotide-excising tRNase
MIDSIRIADVASYGSEPQVLDGLSQFNFFYGTNATGKTTISKIIADPSAFPTCSVVWRAGTNLQTMVYNRDFINENFRDLKGIFTLGKKTIETQDKIGAAKAKAGELQGRIEQLTGTLQGEDGKAGKRGELNALEGRFEDACWRQKQSHDEKLSGAFEGYRNSAQRFKEKILAEKAHNSATFRPLKELENAAESVFGSTPTTELPVISLAGADLLALESDPVLKKRVVGKADVDIAAMIQKLGNSDWVKQGLAFYSVNDRRCPFCQQPTPDSLAQSLNHYFDETFEKDSEAIEKIEADYETAAEQMHDRLATVLSAPSKFLDVEKLKTEKALLESGVALNLQRIATKKREPSRIVELESLRTVLAALDKSVEDANSQVFEHNDMVKNLAQERSDLTAQVWRYLLDAELKEELAEYETKKDALNKAITSLSAQVSSLMREKAQKEREIRDLEKDTTSIQPTVDAINGILSSFGFLGFSLEKAGDGRSYRLVRPTGADAKETLSEGEQSFVTFLYFYNLLKGSTSESGTTTDRVVVFDDPVSSFDSNVLFVVSGLIRGLCDEVRSGKGNIKQVFVLTHNVYFHKEVTFNPRRTNRALNEETFWIVRRPGLMSKVEKHNDNPVKTAYEMLWAEVRSPDRSKHTIQNVLRRILESYFNIVCGVSDIDKICERFEGQDKVICRSLFSWVSAGSHRAPDDLYVSFDDQAMEAYLRVFKGVFEKLGHLPHYEMMMGDADG